ncbi:MAG: hypothetical protein COA50_16875 [Flavobacteriaceae bacterium]|nr:MAG: hypothetical protein COA50_16875 [Flavobacteriaceae bacterium]
MSSKKEKILTTALTLFNQRGVLEVTVRDIAKEVGISSGNLTYHFPTKNEILVALMNLLLTNIEQALDKNEPNESALLTYYHQFETIFKEQLKFKFLFNKRYAEVITTNLELQTMLQEVLPGRFVQWKEIHKTLITKKYANPDLLVQSNALYHIINILALYWHQEIEIYHPKLPAKEKVPYALSIMFQIYKPYLTKKGLGDLTPFLIELKPYKV